MDLTALPTWIGVTLGAIITATVTWLVFAATRRKDHHQRRWERQVEVYERVLLEAAAWTADRAKAMHSLPADGGSAIAALDEVERRRTRIRLRMFGHQEVRDAFERYADAHWTWAGIHAALNELYATQHQVNTGELPAHQDMSEEIRAKQSEAKAAQKRADQAETELIDTIEQVLKRVPKSIR
ncbi:hypothetical protein [Kutzneria sp. 744]|uniref:hypothetical protein n=1 Tax=Kutzneria sp. (strain 744) TaxID=345341 RepID=UPI0003EED834|nr:hypothetical protein [Kutzneria sp. 744]EWM15305.1 hypothetical protein KUTG_05609 [Kutzneria sp. 744]